MKKTAVEWLVEQIDIKNPNWLKEQIKQAKEKENQQQYEFAIKFAEWIVKEETKELIIDLKTVGELSKQPSTKELLEIFKKEKGL